MLLLVIICGALSIVYGALERERRSRRFLNHANDQRGGGHAKECRHDPGAVASGERREHDQHRRYSCHHRRVSRPDPIPSKLPTAPMLFEAETKPNRAERATSNLEIPCIERAAPEDWEPELAD